jgi:hypothetical protein
LLPDKQHPGVGRALAENRLSGGSIKIAGLASLSRRAYLG